MIPLLIPTEKVRALLVGSNEEMTERIQELAERERERIFGEDVNLKVIGTFKGQAIVASDTAKFAKIMFESTNAGDLMIVKSEFVDIPVYDNEDKIRSFLQNEALSVIDSFFVGDTDGTQVRLIEMMRVMDGRTSHTDKQIATAMIEGIKQNRLWKSYEADKVEEALIEYKDYEPKFSKIWEGTIPEKDHEGYRALITSDLKDLSSQMEAVSEQTSHTVASLTKLIETKPKLSEDAQVIALKKAVEDLQIDLLQSQADIASTLQNVKTISALGEVHDAMAMNLKRQEVACRYISMAVDLLSSAEK